MLSLAAIGSTVANNRAVQWALGVGAAVLAFLWWLAQHDRKVLTHERLRAERKARKTQEAIRETNNEKSQQVERARESAPSGVDHSDSVPDELRDIIIRD